MVLHMKIAIVGFGVIGRVHFEVLQDLGYDVRAVCDVDYKLHDCLPNVPFYMDYFEMLEKEKPDVVHICTPHYLHEQMIITALNNNIHVLCEKPLCISKKGIERILQAEKESKAQLGVCHQNRYNPDNLFVKEYLSDKKVIGGHGSMLWHRDSKYYASSEWRGKWKTEGGGVLINQALHTLDIMQWLLGFPKEVTASVSNLTLKNDIEVEDTANLICYGNTDFSLFATNGSTCDLPIEIMIKTDKETISIIDSKVLVGNSMYDFHDDVFLGKPCYGSGHLNLISDFYDCIKTGRKFEIDGQESSKVIKIILSAYESDGKRIKI